MNSKNITLILLVVLASLVVYGQYQTIKITNAINHNLVAGAASVEPNEGAVKVEFCVMSQCPYGTQVEDSIKPVLDILGSDVDFRLDFIANDLGGGAFRSLHGEPEVKGDIVQLCAMEYEPAKYMDMIVCMNKDARSIPDNWEPCAEDSGLDVDSIRVCYEGDEGKELMSSSILRSQALKATGSPTIYINNKPYSGKRDSKSFMQTICAEYAVKPDACTQQGF